MTLHMLHCEFPYTVYEKIDFFVSGSLTATRRDTN
jgi:hypothetical protein